MAVSSIMYRCRLVSQNNSGLFVFFFQKKKDLSHDTRMKTNKNNNRPTYEIF